MSTETEEELRLRSGTEAGAPRVSVVVPTYKSATTLHDAVMSLLQQDFRDLEVVVVDDACPENSTRVIRNISDPRLRVIRLDSNSGLSGARNAGIEASHGSYISFLDADDTSLPSRIRLQVELLDRSPEVGLVGGLHNRIDASGVLIHRATDIWRLSDSALRPLLLFDNPFTSAVMIRRSAIPAWGYRPMLAEDYAMTSDVAEKFRIAMLRTAIINYRSNPSGIMSTEGSRVYAGGMMVKKMLLAKVGVPSSAYDESVLLPARTLTSLRTSRERTEMLEHYRDFLRTVWSSNVSTRVYPESDMADAICRKWDRVLHDAASIGGLRIEARLLKLFAAFWPQRASRMRAKALVKIFAIH